MNKDRRQQIVDACSLVSTITTAIIAARSAIEQVKDEEEEALNALPDAFRQGEKGQAMEAAVAALDDALNAVDEIDTATIVASLEEASDRAIAAETIESRTSPKQREQRRWDLLPDFAKERIAQLEQKIERMAADTAEPYAKATGAADEFTICDWLDGPLNGRTLPFKTIDAPAHGVRIQADSRGLLIHAQRRLVIHPNSGNEVILKSDDWN